MQAQHIEFLDLLNGQVQYVVPRWQRRYRWGQADIERLVEDLLAVATATAAPDTAHYGGTLLTFPEPGPAGVVKTICVVDGQQRLTTVSLLLSCIADKLGDSGQYGEWTAQIIRDDRLTNPGKPKDKFRKLRLQDGDEEDYRKILAGDPSGPGAVTQAWKTLRRLVSRHDPALLLAGLERLRVVSIGLGPNDDPQQIFESLNATGRPLTESEKVKNWLLMGLSDDDQQDLYERHWIPLQRSLGAERATEPIDIFIRDVLRWRSGEVRGIDGTYDGLRRWAVKHGHARDRPALCRELARLAGLYGILTRTAGPHPDPKVERELRHLRALGIDVHRPLSLRLLNDASPAGENCLSQEALAKILAAIGTWATRLWLADRQLNGMNTAVTELACGARPGDGEEATEYWLWQIRKLRNTRVGVPSDQAVRDGIRTRKAYGGSATRSSKAILCALMEAEQPDEAPAREHLTIEHVMPQKLTDDWKRTLGDGAEDMHGRFRDQLANLTLSGGVPNSTMAADLFVEKCRVYKDSAIKMTKWLAEECDEWDEEALERRSQYLADRALKLWPWSGNGGGNGQRTTESAALKWRLSGGEWRIERFASQMVLNIASALLSRDPENARRLAGQSVRSNVHPVSQYPTEIAREHSLRPIPGHDQYVMYPYTQNYLKSAELCHQMGERCQQEVEILFDERSPVEAFWSLLKERTGGLPGQTDTWRGPNQKTSPVNSSGDRIRLYAGSSDHLHLYVRAGKAGASGGRAGRMRQYSWMIHEQMGDQEIFRDPDKCASEGSTVHVQRRWVWDDEAGWPDAARWVKEQHDRLHAIVADPPDGLRTEGDAPAD